MATLSWAQVLRFAPEPPKPVIQRPKRKLMIKTANLPIYASKDYTPTTFLVNNDREFSKDFCVLQTCSNQDFNTALSSRRQNAPEDRNTLTNALERLVAKHRMTKLDRFLAYIRVMPTTTATPDPIKFYTFHEQGTVGRIVPCAFENAVVASSRKREVVVRIAGEWVRAEQWLSSLPVHSHGTKNQHVGDGGYKNQSKYWFRTRKSFRFLDLPGEIRTTIYQHAIGHRVYPEDHRNRYRGSQWIVLHEFPKQWKGYEYLPPWWQATSPRPKSPPAIELLRVNRQVHDECLSTTWELSVLCFSGIEILGTYVLNPKPKYTNLRRLGLEFGFSEFLEFFCMGYCPANRYDACILQNLPQLSELQLWFASTIVP
ncbi:hypothetical protein EJ08DRAFT_692556 [Tothia fuscella]|uniref:Uncharacterized protein n=1 Tax=Tothia fuscella TaxID=1048955 RepID=A0A9P4U220_9PEZI|nr:hypothetical protein EJ08DRAFT_692556 [Tothia fuscella]